MKTKKWRDVKNALVMVVVMAAMMSTATYAWFTLTSNATVTGMQMTAGGSSGLKVSTDNANWYDAVSLEQLDAETGDPIKQVINQVTIKEEDKTATGVYAPTFYKPVYGTTAESVNGVTDVTQIYEADEPLTDYMAKYTYYLKTEADSDATVGIVVAPVPGSTQNVGIENGSPLVDGSFVREVGTSSANTAARAVRVGIVVDGKMYVYEPNNGTSNTSEDDASTDYTGTYKSSIISDTTGAILADSALGEKSGVTDGTGYEVSQGLFTVGNTGKEVTMYVWLEGTDEDCVNDIKADDIEAQIQFTIVEQP